jgi:hypothetical protein
MNLKNEFDKILGKYGHPVLIVRQDKKLRCSCWNEKTQEADRQCPRCFGIGWNPIVEKHTVRTEDSISAQNLGRIGSTANFGQISVPSRSYYISSKAKVHIKDLMVDVDWTPSGKPVYSGGGIYEVTHVDESLRFENGEQIYKAVQCKDTPIQKNIRGIRIAQVNGIVNYELAMEDV